jgi:AcrR family transcriptional regulator
MSKSPEIPRLMVKTRQGGYAVGQARVSAILSAALDVLIEQGYGAITFREIARRCGLRVGAVNYYYRTRNELIRELIESVISPYLKVVDSIFSDPKMDAEQRFLAVLTLMLEDLDTKKTTHVFPELWALSNRNEFVAEQIEQLYRREHEVFERLIRDVNPALSAAERNAVALFISSSIEGLTLFIGHGKPWRQRRDWLNNVTAYALLSMVRNISNNDVRKIGSLRKKVGH